MPAVFERTFRVRHYECDLHGHLNHVNYVRYMQEAAIDASSDVGWTPARYQELERGWVARETMLEFLRPVHADDHVIIRTFVEDFRRVRSWRRYEFRLAGTDEPVARGATEWIYVDTARGMPVAVPDAMVLDFHPEGMPESAPAREKFPDAPAPPPDVFRQMRRVEWRDIDTEQHVNNAVYVAYLEDASVQVGRHHGWSIARIAESGFAMMLRQIRLIYLKPAQLDDELAVSTWVSNVRGASALRHYTITRPADEATLVRAVGQWVCLNRETLRPMRFPEAFMADMAANHALED